MQQCREYTPLRVYFSTLIASTAIDILYWFHGMRRYFLLRPYPPVTSKVVPVTKPILLAIKRTAPPPLRLLTSAHPLHDLSNLRILEDQVLLTNSDNKYLSKYCLV